MFVETLLEQLDSTPKPMQKQITWQTLENVCLSAIAVQKHDGVKPFSETVALCLSCMHWTQHKKKHHIPPLVEFKWHIRTMQPLSHKRFDKRTVHRIAAVLTQPNNFYRHLFSEQELKHCHKMAQVQSKFVNGVVAQLFDLQNAQSIFVKNAHVAELLRT